MIIDRKALAGAACVVCVMACINTAFAAEWKWLSTFTPNSSEELAALHEELNTPNLAGVLGVPVENVTWKGEAFELRIRSGTIYLEPEVQGYRSGAFFAGEATVHFALDAPKARKDMDFWLGAETLENEPVSHAYFFTLRGRSVLDDLGVSGEPSVPFASAEPYGESKAAMRQLGTTLVHAFLNRDGRSKGATYVLFAPESIRTRGSTSACLLYSHDPNREDRIELAAFGHDEVRENLPHKFYFWPLAWAKGDTDFVPHGRAKLYSTKLSVGRGMNSAEEETTISFAPNAGTHALRLEFAPRMEVVSVEGPGGEALPFLQWAYLQNDPNYDQQVIVSFPEAPEEATPLQITVKSSGSLFEPWYDLHWLAEEDTWHPRLDDPSSATFELVFTVPRKTIAVGAGKILAEEEEGAERRYHFQTTRPHKRSTIYFGDFLSRAGQADETVVEVFVAKKGLGAKNIKYAITEIENIIRVYNRILRPLEMNHLRVAATPTRHGRGFEGLILLSRRAGFAGGPGSDIFRAHEVAHQWWGNIVQPERWPEDRWLSEAFAEYTAMEYFRIRSENPKKVRDQIRDDWVMPVVNTQSYEYRNLRGEDRKLNWAEITPLVDGSGNVYTKGPLVLHMLRYLFKVRSGDDAGFWELLREFLDQNPYRQSSTADFMALSEKHLGAGLDWFWDQWYYRGEIPTVTWSHKVEPHERKWLVTVEAQQKDTEFMLVLPVNAHFGGDRVASEPLILDGKSGKLQMLLPERPVEVTLNDEFEALVKLRP